MIARSSMTSFEKVKRIGVCIIGGARDKSMRTLMCHSPDFSSTDGVLTVNTPPAAKADRPERRIKAVIAADAKRASAARKGEMLVGVGLMARARLHPFARSE